MSDQKDFSIRRVTKDDYSKVMDMFPPGEIYNGRDYLPDYFYMLIDMPNVEAYAAMIGDKIVYTIIDKGESVVPRAVRTRTEYEGRGIALKVYYWFLKNSPRKYSFKYQVGTVEGSIKSITRKRLETGQLQKILERRCRSYLGTKECLTELGQGVNNTSLQSIGVDELGEILANQNLCHRLFTAGYAFVDWVPYKAIKSNAVLIKNERTTIITSNLFDLDSALLTFSSFFNASIGLVWSFDIYGQIGDTLREHLLRHFRKIHFGKDFKRVFLRFYCDEDADLNIISDIMNSCGFTNYPNLDCPFTCYRETITKSSKL